MATVSINPPKTPVTEGNNGIAAATTPNVCKMPGPPAPFVPTPLPNIGRSGITPQGYSTKVRIEGSRVAIRGATFGSLGDIAAKPSGGGIVSANVEGPTKFVGPGSMDVRIEGKNVQLLGDPMLNNCGPSGSPPNAATLCGVITPTGAIIMVTGKDPCPLCGKNHEALKESEGEAGSKADAKKLKEKFEALTQTHIDETGKRHKPKPFPATMLGVVHGKCGRKYGGQSGAVYRELCDAATANGLESFDVKWPSYFPIKSEQERERNTRDPDAESIEAVKKGILARVGEDHQAAFEKVWKKAVEAAERSFKEREEATFASYPPGACAAQKTLLLAQDRGCVPAALTELWHHPKGKPTSGRIRHFKSGGRRADDPFPNDESVPPCGTCCTLLLYLLCPGEQEVCKHHGSEPTLPQSPTRNIAPSSHASSRGAPTQSAPPPSAPSAPPSPATSTAPTKPRPGSGPFRGGGGGFGGGGASGDW
ncbi:MAG: hypothetical protein RLZZ450_7144 [Pseudomonadota bacterium]|jgi:hypothetical protein